MWAIGIRRPWPWTIFEAPYGASRILNMDSMPWPVAVGTQIAICASFIGFDAEAIGKIREMDFLFNPPPQFGHPTGIVGVAVLDGWVLNSPDTDRPFDEWSGFGRTKARATCQDRWFTGPYGWVISEVRKLANPVPFKCRIGVFKKVGAQYERQIMRDLEGS